MKYSAFQTSCLTTQESRPAQNLGSLDLCTVCHPTCLALVPPLPHSPSMEADTTTTSPILLQKWMRAQSGSSWRHFSREKLGTAEKRGWQQGHWSLFAIHIYYFLSFFFIILLIREYKQVQQTKRPYTFTLILCCSSVMLFSPHQSQNSSTEMTDGYCWPNRCMDGAVRLSTATPLLPKPSMHHWLNLHSQNNDRNILTALGTVKDLALQRNTHGGLPNAYLRCWLQERPKPAD